MTHAMYTSDFREQFEADTLRLLRRRFLWFTGLSFSLGLLVLATVIAVAVLSPETGSGPEGASGPVGVDPAPGESLEEGSGGAGATGEGEGAGAVSPAEAGAALGEAAEPEEDAEGPRGGKRVVINNPLEDSASIAGAGLSTLAYLAAFVLALKGSLDRRQTLGLTFALVVVDGLLHIALRVIRPEAAFGLGGVLVTHVLACLFLPWSPAQAIRPLLPLLVISALAKLTLESGATAMTMAGIAFSPLIGLPGTLICWARQSRRMNAFKVDFLQARYGQLRRELVDARRIHESLFPERLTEGPLRFDYLYEPMRQIGGDYLHAHSTRDASGAVESLSVVILDVTGHGIPAALTVNRLHGELERLFAENPRIDPGEVLRALNRYVHLTLATHSVYVTALCLRANLSGSTLEYASGGHPPAFLRAVDGTIDQLDSTAFVLGACHADDFVPAPATRPFGPGDALIAYTDGATEARGISGKMLGISGIQRVLASGAPEPQRGWCHTLLGVVDRHRAGPPSDDTLVVELYRPLDLRQARGNGEGVGASAGAPSNGRAGAAPSGAAS